MGRQVGGGAAHCQPVKDAGTIQCAECVEQITARGEGDLLAGGQDEQGNTPGAKDANANNCASIRPDPVAVQLF